MKLHKDFGWFVHQFDKCPDRAKDKFKTNTANYMTFLTDLKGFYNRALDKNLNSRELKVQIDKNLSFSFCLSYYLFDFQGGREG